MLARTDWPEKLAWTGHYSTGQTESTEWPKHDSKDVATRPSYGQPGLERQTGQSEHGRRSWRDKNADTVSRDKTGGTGQLWSTVGTGQLQQDSHSRKDMLGWLEKIGQDSWDRTIKTGQLWQESQDKRARTGQGKLGQDNKQETH